MKKLLVVALFLALGCEGPPEDRLVKKQIKLNDDAAAKVDKAEKLSELKRIMHDYSAQKKLVLNDLRNLGRERAVKVVNRLEDEATPSMQNLQQALGKFHERLKSDKASPVIRIETSDGPITVELVESLAPITVKNFLKYVDEKFYDGTIFHRVIPTFMIQGGGFEPGMRKEKPTHPAIVNESYNGLANDRGTIAMARTDQPNSATAQFFINVVDNGFLNLLQAPDGVGYAVFGKVTDGMDVVDKIRHVKTKAQDVPVNDVIIKSIRRVEKKT